MSIDYNEHTRLLCVTYKDPYSAGKESMKDLQISFENKVFAAGSKQLGYFEANDYVLICATKEGKRLGFVSRITERLDTPLRDWHDQGGKIWPYNFRIEPVTGITEITCHSEIRNHMEFLMEECGLSKTNLFHPRFCSNKLIRGLAYLVEQGMFEPL